MSYRVECAVSGRAGCQQSECKDANIKIEKNELRFGVWVEFQEHGSWRWKHWGCVTGKQLQNMRTYLDPEGTGNYQWDRLDGYDSEDKGSLNAHPDLQEKVRRVITQGFIDPEDWNGDPEMNKLGESGIRTKETLKRLREDKKARNHEVDELKAQLAAAESERDSLKKGSVKKPAAKKRARAKMESDDEDAFEDAKPAPKKRVARVKKEEADVNDEPVSEVKPKAKKVRKSAIKEEVADEDTGVTDIPEPKSEAAAKNRKRAVKKEETDTGDELAAEAKPKAAKKGRKAAVKEEALDEENVIADAPDIKPKAATKKGHKKSVKKEEAEVQDALREKVKGEAVEPSSSLSAIPSLVQDEGATGGSANNGEESMEADKDDAQDIDVAAKEDAKINYSRPKKSGSRVKTLPLKGAAPMATSTRGSRNRAASKN